MAGPLADLRVVEVGVWVAGPATAAILADWGADVIKIEAPAGDPLRGMSNPARIPGVNPPFEMDNRGKRSVAIDLAQPAGYQAARRLIDRADVFVTNLIPRSVEQLRLSDDDLRPANPGLIYCRVTGYGPAGADRDRPSFDAAAYWSRSGIMLSLQEEGADCDPPNPRGGVGDHSTAMAAVAGICAALVARGRTGRGQIVDASLYRTGIYTMAWDLSMHLRTGTVVPQSGRRAVNNPLVNPYRAGDGRWFYLVNLQADRFWPGFLQAIAEVAGEPAAATLAEDARFADLRSRRTHAKALITALDTIISGAPRDEWGAAFDRHGIVWAKVQSIAEVADDPQAAAAGGWVDVDDGAGGTLRMVAPPAGFSDFPVQPLAAAPELGQHTESLLLEQGYTWEEITALKASGAIG